MDYEEILTKIIRRYGAKTENIRAAQVIESKLKRHAATYADAENYAQQIGRVLTDAFREYLPEALTDGMLYRAAAEVLVGQPMKAAGKDIDKVAAEIQESMNEAAGIGMKAVIPKMNQDQIDGIITGICNAESYAAGEALLMDRVENCLEGHVDDFVRENADFQYKAGLSPTIERRTVGKCCEWCDRLAGSHPYEEVRDKGNDVYKRHRNCHCLILFNPGDGSKRRQDVRSRLWTDEEKVDRIAKSKMMELDLQQFSGHKKGEYRAMMFRHNWQGASLKEARRKFTPKAEKTKSPGGRKTYYISKDGHYRIEYDRSGKYFRIKDIRPEAGKKSYLRLDGTPANEVMENGIKRPATDDEYEIMTHFLNADKGG